MRFEDIIRILIIPISYITVFISLIPFLRSKVWFIRIFDYPRSQKFYINLTLLILFLIVGHFSLIHDGILLGALIVNQIHLLVQIWPYLPFGKKQMKRVALTNNPSIKILIANVFQDNTNYDQCISLIKDCNPDIIVLLETDKKWFKALKSFTSTYPYNISKPQDNTYGIVMFSKLKIVNHKIRFLIDEEIPSIVADIMHQGKVFRFYALHPKPPVPQESDDSTERDAEILLIGKEAKKYSGPVIVAGDLNDVAWSYTTRLFLKVSGLLDPRRGRGFFSTFHANYWLFRWPLDHVFCSSHFYLHKLERLRSINSDHFPIFIEVSLMQHEVKENKMNEKHANEDEIEMVNEVIEEAKEKVG